MPPVNDDFADATDLGSGSGQVTFSNVDATTEGGEPSARSSGSTVWFKWTAPADGTVKFSTALTPLPHWDSTLDVYTGAGLGSLTQVASNDDGDLQAGDTSAEAADGYGTSSLTISVTASTVYWIRADCYNEADLDSTTRDDAVLSWQFSLPAPTISSVAPAQSINGSGDTITVTGTNLDTATGVTIAGAAVAFTIVSATEIQFVMPTVGAAGGIVVSGPGGDATHDFTVLFPGPWLPGEPFDLTVDYSAPTADIDRSQAFTSAGKTFVDACEGTANTGSGGSFLNAGAANVFGVGVQVDYASGDPTLWETSQARFNFNSTPITSEISSGNLAAYPPERVFPPDEVGMQYETSPGSGEGTSTPTYTLGDGTAALGVDLNPPETVTSGSTTIDVLHAQAGTLEARPNTTTGTWWQTDMQLAAVPAVASVAVDGTEDQSATLSIPVGAADWPSPQFLLSMAAQVTHDAPTYGTPSNALSWDEIWGTTCKAPSSLSVTVTVLRNRYRFLFDHPLLTITPAVRQYPRDDYLGHSPRQFVRGGASSRQATNRHGVRATYL